MPRTSRCQWLLLLAISWLAAGCAHRNRSEVDFGPPDMGYYQEFATAIEYPDAENPVCDDLAQTPPPLTLTESDPPPFRDVTLQEADCDGLVDLGGSA